MEHQFKKFIQKIKAQKEQKDPLFKTFEGALFEDSSWFLQTEEAPFAFKTSDTEQSLIEVLFVGDTYKGDGEDLLGKMISAMKLSGGDFHRFLLDEALEEVNDLEGNLKNPDAATSKLLTIIQEKRPKVVVSLGATVTNILLGKREKLSTIHGQFLEKRAGDWTYGLMPVFHPDFLLINPNMKRTAWIDLQKVMERVGKI